MADVKQEMNQVVEAEPPQVEPLDDSDYEEVESEDSDDNGSTTTQQRNRKAGNYETLNHGIRAYLSSINQSASGSALRILNELATGILFALLEQAERLVANSNKTGSGVTKNQPRITMQPDDIYAAIGLVTVFRTDKRLRETALENARAYVDKAIDLQSGKNHMGLKEVNEELNTIFSPGRINSIVRRNSGIDRLSALVRYALVGALDVYIPAVIDASNDVSEQIGLKKTSRLMPKYIAAGLKFLGLVPKFEHLDLGYKFQGKVVEEETTDEEVFLKEPKKPVSPKKVSPKKKSPKKRQMPVDEDDEIVIQELPTKKARKSPAKKASPKKVSPKKKSPKKHKKPAVESKFRHGKPPRNH